MRYIWLRTRRKPLASLGIFLFAAVVSLVLCTLHRGNMEAQAHYDDIFGEIDVRCTVTNLAGTQSDRLNIHSGLLSLFTEPSEGGSAELLDYLGNVQIKGSVEFSWEGETYTLEGITAPEIEPALQPENGCVITWNPGEDSGMFGGNELKCLVPQSMINRLREMEQPEDRVSLSIQAPIGMGEDYEGEPEIAGIYEGHEDKTLYCPWKTYVAIIRSMGDYETADSLYATLRDNRELDELRERSSEWFAQPDGNSAGLTNVGDYYLALDINDSQLEQANQTLENSLTVNRVVAILVFCLSAVAGAFVGFLIIRSRKRDIVLMRTLGTPDGKIYSSFALEQMVFLLLGVLAGGTAFRWVPLSWLSLFVCVYFAGLSIALLVMLHGNLLATMKEKE